VVLVAEELLVVIVLDRVTELDVVDKVEDKVDAEAVVVELVWSDDATSEDVQETDCRTVPPQLA
jgi:hypothetical protein